MKVTEFEIFTKEPESLTVGELNQVVRALREEIYQLRLKLQESKINIITEPDNY